MASSPVDLEAIVIDWAKKMFDVTKSKEQGKINRDALQYTVNWKFTRTHHSEPEYSEVTKPADPKSQVRHMDGGIELMCVRPLIEILSSEFYST